MYADLKATIRLLSPRQTRDLVILQLFMICTSFAELTGVISILPFIAVAGEPSIINENETLRHMYLFLSPSSTNEFTILLGILFIGTTIFANTLMLATQALMNRYSSRLGRELSATLYNSYLNQDILFFKKINSSRLIQHLLRNTEIFSKGFVAQALTLNSRTISIILLCALTITIDIKVAAISLAVLFGAYFSIFRSLRRVIHTNGSKIIRCNRKINRLLTESFEGIKDIKFYSAERKLSQKYNSLVIESSRSSANNLILAQSPYFFIEMLSMVGITSITLYFLISMGSIEKALPTLTLYALAAVKLIPKFQQAYNALTTMKGSHSAASEIISELKLCPSKMGNINQTNNIEFHHSIVAKSVCFSYGRKRKDVLRNINFEIKKGTHIGIVGPTGSGKSTLIELLTGLLIPTKGDILIDNTPLQAELIAAWQQKISYVPQSIFLTDGTIAENIAFMEAKEKINWDQVNNACKIVELSGFIEAIPDGYDTQVGERGNQLSGGQRQRLGIARAIYKGAKVLVLDEATSALDNDTQSKIVDRLHNKNLDLTIITITHRPEALKFCSERYRLDSGILYKT